MLARAIRLRQPINNFYRAYKKAQPFSFSTREWKIVGYILDIKRPLAFYTQTIGKTSSPTLPYAFHAYDNINERLNETYRRLLLKHERKRLPAAEVLLDGINAAWDKLDKYY